MATLTTYRRTAASLIGRYRLSTATGSSTVSQVVDTSWPIMSNLEQNDLFQDYYLFRPSASSADKTRIVSTYTPSTGVLVADKTWAVAPTSGEAYELHGIVEPSILHECINAALKRIPVLIEFVMTPSLRILAGDSVQDIRHAINNLPLYNGFITEPWQIVSVGALPTGQTDRDIYTPTPIRGKVTKDGTTIYLTGFSLAATDYLYISLIKPAYNHCKATGGTYGDQDGLSAETDEAPVDDRWVAYGAICEAWQRERPLMNETANARLISSEVMAAAMFNRYSEEHWKTPQQSFRPLHRWGPGP